MPGSTFMPRLGRGKRTCTHASNSGSSIRPLGPRDFRQDAEISRAVSGLFAYFKQTRRFRPCEISPVVGVSSGSPSGLGWRAPEACGVESSTPQPPPRRWWIMIHPTALWRRGCHAHPGCAGISGGEFCRGCSGRSRWWLTSSWRIRSAVSSSAFCRSWQRPSPSLYCHSTASGSKLT